MQHQTHILSEGTLLYSWFEAMHTRIDMILWDAEASVEEIKIVAERIKTDVERVERMGSCFRPESEISMFNSSSTGKRVLLSDELHWILERCRDFNIETDGLFDVSVTEGSTGMRFYQRIRLHEDGSAEKITSDAYVNLSGYLKGYALDRAVRLAKESGISNGLLNFGNSSIYAFGNHPKGRGWPVASDDGSRYVLHDESLTTSGNCSSERKHIINPLTGELISGKGTASVIRKTAEEGEVASTVSFIRMNIDTETQKI